ncbi:MAG TPA: hypothetical protein PLD59_04660 [Tepidisphaeraceae bacterium]|nr:hypothetical protein [Tepidisphaeraceae bacterium]
MVRRRPRQGWHRWQHYSNCKATIETLVGWRVGGTSEDYDRAIAMLVKGLRL